MAEPPTGIQVPGSTGPTGKYSSYVTYKKPFHTIFHTIFTKSQVKARKSEQ